MTIYASFMGDGKGRKLLIRTHVFGPKWIKTGSFCLSATREKNLGKKNLKSDLRKKNFFFTVHMFELPVHFSCMLPDVFN